MKTLLISTLAAGFMASTAIAAPMQLTDAQLDQVAAGTYEDGGHKKGHDGGKKRRHGGKKKDYGKHDYAGHYYPYYYNYNDNYNDNDNDNYNYNENNNYIYISIPFFGYDGYGGHGGHGGGKGGHGGGKRPVK